jgi:pyrophosphatase PpaX
MNRHSDFPSDKSANNPGVSAATIETILFDFDGTLVNTTPLILHCFRLTWEKLFGFTLPESAYIQTFGIPIEKAMQQLLLNMLYDQQVAAISRISIHAERMVSTYREFNLELHDQMIAPFVGIAELLTKLKSDGRKLGLVTSKKRAGAERGMRIFEMQNFFDVTICAEDSSRHKPHPEPLLCALQSLNTPSSATVYVGDSIHDIAAGRAASVTTVAAAWGPFTRTQLEAADPDHIAETPLEVLSIVR